MKMKGVIVVGVLMVGLVAVPTAHGAATRAEYVAQVDPTCQSFVGPLNDAKTKYNRDYKEWVRRLSKGTLKGWVRQTARTARSLTRLNEVHASLTEQIAAVPAPAEDAGTIATWLNYRRQAESFANSAASAFKRFKFERSDKQLARANKAEGAGINAISGMGLHVCGVSV